MAARATPNPPTTPLRHGRLRTPDGADLAVYEAGSGPGPTLILVGGLCGDVDAFRLLIDDFAPWHRVVAWDYRGLFASTDGIRRDQRVERHAQDLRSTALWPSAGPWAPGWRWSARVRSQTVFWA